MEMWHSLDSQISHSLDSSQSSTLPLVWSSCRASSITWHRFYASNFSCGNFPERIDFKLAVLVFKCLNGLAPSYLACEFHRVADVKNRQRLLSASSSDLINSRVRCATIGGRTFQLFQSRLRMYGTLFHQAWRHRRVWLFSGLAWKQSCSSNAPVLTNIDSFSTFITRFY